jgi:GrpB-like predicted nucleotidyltransferase (UPF0157 family)
MASPTRPRLARAISSRSAPWLGLRRDDQPALAIAGRSSSSRLVSSPAYRLVVGEDLQSDDEIAAVRIGPPEVLDGQITLVDYDASWPQLFEREATRIRAALGDQALLVEHVGSTSVPGLAAKPRIDIVLAVADSSDEPTYAPPLVDSGYVLRVREPAWYEHRVFKGPDTDVNLHVFSAGCPEIERMVRFRDHLRMDRDDRALYEQTKRDLARRRWKYTQHYADAKAPVVEEILARSGRNG